MTCGCVWAHGSRNARWGVKEDGKLKPSRRLRCLSVILRACEARCCAVWQLLTHCGPSNAAVSLFWPLHAATPHVSETQALTHFKLHWHDSAKLFCLLHSCLHHLTQAPPHSRVVPGESRCRFFSLSPAFTMVITKPKHYWKEWKLLHLLYFQWNGLSVPRGGEKIFGSFSQLFFQSIKLSKLQVLKNIQIHK